MEHSFFHRLSNFLWGGAVTLIVLLAVYVSAGRLLSSNLGAYQQQILQELNSRVPFDIEASRLQGEWRSFTPELVLTDLRLSTREGDAPPLVLTGGRIGLDVLDSLRTRSLQFTTLQLDQLSLQGEMTAEGKLRIPGLSGNGGEIGQWLREFLLNVEVVTLRDNLMQLRLPSGEQRDFSLNLRLDREGSQRYVEAEMLSTRGTRIHLVGEGLGNPFRPDEFDGDLYLEVDSADLGAVKDMLANGPPGGVWAEGELGLQLWLAWNRGEVGVDARVEARDMVLSPADQSWQVPLDHLAFTASLVERRNRRVVFASDLQLRQGDTVATLPRLQLDSWDTSLRLRAEDIALAPLNALLLGQEYVPAKLLDVFATLQPRGSLDSLQLSVGDISRPTRDWTVEANFSQLAVESWRGAPGVTNASGYVDLAPGGGYVVLDSQQFTMNFPTVYRDPLFYDDFHGTLKLSWDSSSLLLDSGAITALAAEGTATALFRLNIPFTATDVGLEMDLMVGLADSHPVHRVKYVPYTLNAGLLDWLAGSIGEGDVEQGAFIWRGSLRRGASDLRTVQLFLNVHNTALDYHPGWPPVSGVKGVVLIDDTNVSVWAERARLFESEVQRLSAEAWMSDSQQMMLDIQGEVSGSAADGLRAINESLLGELVGGVFAEWQAEGELDTRLDLLINLGDKTVPPEVEVETVWRGVDLQIQPGNLAVQQVSGQFDYSSITGFSSRDLAGRFWGEPLTARVEQFAGEDGRRDAGKGVLEVQLAAPVAMADVQQWLALDSLALASGEAAVDAVIRVAPGEPTQLHLVSDLQGVALDLPRPWTKTAVQQRSLDLQFPLAGDDKVLELALGEDLRLDMALMFAGASQVGASQATGGLRGASLAFDGKPVAIEDQVLRITGRAPLVDVEGWNDFVERYFISTEAASAAGDDSAVAGDRDSAAITVAIQGLQAEQVAMWGQSFADVAIDMTVDGSGSRVTAATSWLQGELFQPADDSPSSLVLQRLDLDGLLQDEDAEAASGSELEESVEPDPAIESPVPPLQLPEMTVTVAELSQGEQVLGHLAFTLVSEADVLHARDIRGELANMALAADKPGELRWMQGQPGQTELEAVLQFKDFGDTLQAFGYEKFLATEQGRVDLNLQWPGAPQDFGLAAANGSLLLDVGRGRFLETPAGATGALRVVGIFNLADMVGRLSMSHMFESGIPFHSLDGEVYLHGGTVEVADLQVQGSSSGFSLNAIADVSSRQLDGELVATLPVANNLPWVAALAAGLPVAAGVFVVSKMFEDQVNRLSSGVYSLSGSWDDPQVEFDRIFDDSKRRELRVVDPNQPQVMVSDDPPLELEPNDPALEPNSPSQAPARLVPDPNQFAPATP